CRVLNRVPQQFNIRSVYAELTGPIGALNETSRSRLVNRIVASPQTPNRLHRARFLWNGLASASNMRFKLIKRFSLKLKMNPDPDNVTDNGLSTAVLRFTP